MTKSIWTKEIGTYPPDALEKLRAAGAVQDPRQRIIAIDEAVAWIKRNYPQNQNESEI